jgi:hypothetical protein
MGAKNNLLTVNFKLFCGDPISPDAGIDVLGAQISRRPVSLAKGL